MAVTGYRGAFIAVLIGGNDFRWQFVERDDELIDMLIQLEAEFWQKVCDNTPPALDGSDASQKFLNSLHPESKVDTRIELPTTALSLVEQYTHANDEIKRLTEEKQEAENLLKQMLGDNEVGVISGGAGRMFQREVLGGDSSADDNGNNNNSKSRHDEEEYGDGWHDGYVDDADSAHSICSTHSNSPNNPDNSTHYICSTHYNNPAHSTHATHINSSDGQGEDDNFANDKDFTNGEDIIITWKSFTQERLDTKAIRAEHPTLCGRYINITHCRKFSIKTAG